MAGEPVGETFSLIDGGQGMKSRIKLGLLSTNDSPFLGYTLREWINHLLKVDAIIMDSKRFSEKDKRIFAERTGGRFPPIPLERFEEQQIPVYYVRNHSSDPCVRLVKDLGIDILVNAGTPRILKSNILEAPKIGVVNCHPGLLPKFRGCTCVEWAIYLDEQVGNTVHFMDEGIDTGPIIIQEALTFSKDDSYRDVRSKVFESSCKLLAKGIEKVITEDLNLSNLPPQSKGSYFGVIGKDQMEEVLSKIERGAYKYQLE